MSFTDVWSNADPDATGGNTEPPEPGMYDVALVDADAFTSKAGDAWIKLAFRTVDGNHEWDVLQGFKSQKQANFTKKVVRDIGVDVDSVADFEELGKALKTVIGKYFTVEVKQNGEFRNTYLVVGAEPDIPVEAAFNATPAEGADEDIPF